MLNTLPKISLATLDGDILDSENAVKFEMEAALILHKPNIYTIWYITYNNIFHKIGVRKYPQTCFQLYCLPGRHINWNKEQMFIIVDRRYNIPSTFEVLHFGIKQQHIKRI